MSARKLVAVGLLIAALLHLQKVSAKSNPRHGGHFGPKRFGGTGRHKGSTLHTIDAHAVHGGNDYNGELIIDWSADSKIFSALPPLPEVGVVDKAPGADNARLITADTPPDAVLANLNATAFDAAFRLRPGDGPFNVPLQEVPTLWVGSTDIEDRLAAPPFGTQRAPDSPMWGFYINAVAKAPVLLRDWNRIAGRMTGRCRRDGGAVVTIEVRDALPSALYTMWDTGVVRPLSDNETVSFGPFGGIPNVLSTDAHGRGSVVCRLPHCPFDKCPGNDHCTLYVSLFYHYDHMVYGGSPLALFSAGTGEVGGEQAMFFLQGKELIPVQNPF